MFQRLFSIAKPALYALDAEIAHNLALKALACPLAVKQAPASNSRLAQNLWGLNFPNPVGLAAGFDKNGDTMDAMLGLGFGCVEVGTVTPLPQMGNPKPRVFRDVSSRSVINRMGFPNKGALALDDRIIHFREHAKNKEGLVGINISKNKDTEDPVEDYVSLIHRYIGVADYLTVNISSPNTAGLRDLQDPVILKDFLQKIEETRKAALNAALAEAQDGGGNDGGGNDGVGEVLKTPILLKLAPDLNEIQIKAIANVVKQSSIDGLILTNTTSQRPETLPDDFRSQGGGLSGAHLKERSCEVIASFYRELDGKMPIIGVGGIENANDAYAKIKAGASLVQLYTALVFYGPALAKDITQGLAALLQKDGFSSIQQAIGLDHK